MTTFPSEPAAAGTPAGLEACRVRVERALAATLPPPDEGPEPPPAVGRLHEAMRYAVLGGGKRVRAALVYLGGELCGAPAERLDAPACAVELVHGYSLVHDDLPAMDDDDFRRGAPSCHRAFDEGTAILVGDALQALAFEVLAEGSGAPPPPPARRLEMVRVLAAACGADGMVAGQAIDLAAAGRTLSRPAMEDMHLRKTGALIRAAVRLGALAAPRRRARTAAHLDRYARCLGLAFQIRDDVLDRHAEPGSFGRPAGSDDAKRKPTWLSAAGVEEADRQARRMCEDAVGALAGLGRDADPLRDLAEFAVARRS